MDYSILGKEVPVSSVDKELRLLWEADDASTKASLINFAIYSEEKGTLLKKSEAVSEITREHSCRAILMNLDREGEKPTIRSWITAHCNLAGGKKAVCCEQVSFLIEGYAPGIVRHTLFSHLDSDLPLVIWWQGALSESYRESFFSKIDRLIFDSSDWDDSKAEMAKIKASIDETPSLVVQDLAWTRTYQFRLAIAAVVDHPAVLSRLEQVSEVKVSSSSQNRTSALQLLAWFANLSGYQISKDMIATAGDVHTYIKSCGGEAKLSASYDDNFAALGSIEINMGDCIVKITREQDRPLLRQEIILNGEPLLDRHCPADAIDDVTLISNQLSRGGKNSLFKRILPDFIEIL